MKLTNKDAEISTYFTPECNINKGDVVVDIGGFIGEFSVYASSKGARQIITYEPCSEPFAEIERLDIPNCIKIKKAVGLTDGETTIYYQSWDPMSSSIYDKSGRPEIVQQVGFQNILNKVGNIDFLKVDCEGPERDFLPRADLSKVKKMAVEWHSSVPLYFGDLFQFFVHISPTFRFTITRYIAPHIIVFVAWRN